MGLPPLTMGLPPLATGETPTPRAVTAGGEVNTNAAEEGLTWHASEGCASEM